MATIEYMPQKQSRSIWWLIIGLTSFSALAWFINTYEPVSWQQVGIFFILLLISAFWSLLYLLNNVRRSLLLSLGLAIYLMLRFFGLHETLYVILLFATITSLELLLSKR